MSLHPVLLSDHRQVLGQAVDLIESLEVSAFRAPAPEAGLASVGEHLRHAGRVERKGCQKEGRDASRGERAQARRV